jgi:phage repressor protein C with HTH and peptisase S24 domain
VSFNAPEPALTRVQIRFDHQIVQTTHKLSSLLERSRKLTLQHQEIWGALDALAARIGTTPSGLARMAGLDPTSFNRSKRVSGDNPPRQRWPSTESVAKVLSAVGIDFSEFALLTEGRKSSRGIPLISLNQATSADFFDDMGQPVGSGWDEIPFPGQDRDGVYALEITGNTLEPAYKDGDRLLVDPHAVDLRRGDRIVLRTLKGELMAMELVRLSAKLIELKALNSDGSTRTMDRDQVSWVARIIWSSQ